MVEIKPEGTGEYNMHIKCLPYYRAGTLFQSDRRAGEQLRAGLGT